MESRGKKDARPEGSILLQAVLYGSWNSVLCIAQHAAVAGHVVTIDGCEHRNMRGMPLQSVTVGGA